MLDMMASEPKRVSEFRASGDTNPGLGQPEVVEVEAPPTQGAKENELGAVLAASTRAGASLSALYRAIQQVTDGVTDARQANEHLTQELSRVREMLGASNEERPGAQESGGDLGAGARATTRRLRVGARVPDLGAGQLLGRPARGA